MFHLFGDSTAGRMPSQEQFPWRLLGLGILALVLITALVTPARNAVIDTFSFSSSAQVEPKQTEEISIGPASGAKPPAQTNPVASVPENPVMPLHEPVWIQVEGDYPSLWNQNQVNIREEKTEWFNQNVWPYIQKDPGFLIPLTLDGSPALAGGLTALYADSDVWVGVVAIYACIQNPCDHEENVANQVLTHRIFLFWNNGKVWEEQVPPPGYREGRPFYLTSGSAITVFNEGDTARINVFAFKGAVYQATVPKQSPP